MLYRKKNYIINTKGIIYRGFMPYKDNIYNLFDDFYKHNIWNYFINEERTRLILEKEKKLALKAKGLVNID